MFITLLSTYCSRLVAPAVFDRDVASFARLSYLLVEVLLARGERPSQPCLPALSYRRRRYGLGRCGDRQSRAERVWAPQANIAWWQPVAAIYLWRLSILINADNIETASRKIFNSKGLCCVKMLLPWYRYRRVIEGASYKGLMESFCHYVMSLMNTLYWILRLIVFVCLFAFAYI